MSDHSDILYYALNTGFMDKNSPTYTLSTGIFDKDPPASSSHIPRLLTNEKNAKVITELRNELRSCQSFTFSVAFISPEVILGLKQDFLDFSQRSDTIQSYIVTSTMNLFNKPKAFEELYKLEEQTNGNIKVKVFGGTSTFDIQRTTGRRRRQYHPKGYYFRHDDYSSVIVGSSNLTNSALRDNYEWNIRFSSMNDGLIVEDIAGAIERQVSDSDTIDLSREFIDEYHELYEASNPELITKIKKEIQQEQGYAPNEMQIEALEALRNARGDYKKRALVVSATGTGKTILCAFDVRRFVEEYLELFGKRPKILFIAHRNLLLNQAKQKFNEVIGRRLTYDTFNGSSSSVDCLFATNIMMSRNLSKFDPEYFDYIIIDESHRSAANTYLDIVNHFNPQFMLGLTATPERADDAQVVFGLFNNNVVYEIRLQQALEAGLVCPFHYYGIADLNDIEDLRKHRELTQHVSEQRVRHIIRNIDCYKHAATPTKGLIFCSRVDEGKKLAEAFTAYGLPSQFLSGDSSEREREEAITALEEGQLQYIFTVDIFNEGVDIPCLNLVVMLRNTESSVVFIQQLGRGLRTTEGKDSVVIIDFIGNYANSYMIPMALYGNHAVTKDALRKRLFDSDDDEVSIGYSSVSFDKIATEKVLASIDKANLNGKTEIKKDCLRLKAMLGRMPLLDDFFSMEAKDPRIILSHSDFNNIIDVWTYSLGDDSRLEAGKLNKNEKDLLSFVSKEFIGGKSYVELVALRSLLKNERLVRTDYAEAWNQISGILSTSFYRETGVPKLAEIEYAKVPEDEDCLVASDRLKDALENSSFLDLIYDVLNTALKINSLEYEESSDFCVGKYYSYKDIWKMLGFAKEEVWLNVGGYKTIDNITPIFVKYRKDDRTAAVRKYEDGFISQELMLTESKSNRDISSQEIQKYINAIRHPVFVRKSDDEADWMFVGDADVIDSRAAIVQNDEKANVRVVEFKLRFHEPVKLSIYNYLTDNGSNTTQW